jgi:hypothetical protein
MQHHGAPARLLELDAATLCGGILRVGWQLRGKTSRLIDSCYNAPRPVSSFKWMPRRSNCRSLSPAEITCAKDRVDVIIDAPLRQVTDARDGLYRLVRRAVIEFVEPVAP